MKILFITDLYPINDSESRTPRTLHNFVFEWIKQGHHVDVIRPNFIFNSVLRGKKLYPDGFYEYEDVKIFNVNYFTPFLFDFLKKLPKEFYFNEYDVVIAHMPSGIIFANKLVKTIKKPLICGVHTSDIEVLTNPIYKFYFKTQLEDAYKNSKKIACRSFVLEKNFKKLMPEFAEKTFVAPSGVELNLVGQVCPTYYSTIKILTCANLIKRKNIDKLILALRIRKNPKNGSFLRFFKSDLGSARPHPSYGIAGGMEASRTRELARKIPNFSASSIKDLEDFELTIIGDGKELKKLKSLSRSGILARQHKIKFLGRLSHKKVLEQMQTANIFILPSVDETFGMVYLEAMASGCVTVCTKNDGIDGIIKDGENGFLTEATVDGIKETLLKIKSTKNIEKIIKNSIETVKKYSPEACAEKYLEQI